ncbi:hypothetical protein RIEGSTA812A_PEG_448 [invertebrate metagenome]|uniref:Sirohydrochlorin cobaltochelatase n=1 Tax=invertebrate metagenome TaxID=1711999 RepID=A0A484H6J3_9ZZZZ
MQFNITKNSIDRFRRSALVLVGHGSTRTANSSLPTRHIAATLRQRALFAEVIACFWKERPLLQEALTVVTADEVFVVPNFSGVGYCTREVIPREMGLSGPLTEMSGANGRIRRIYYTPPVGTHPQLALLVHQWAEAVVTYYDLNRASLCLLLIGHGSRRPGGSSETAETLAVTLRRLWVGKVYTAYLAQEPMVTSWASFISARDILVVPLLIGIGLHGSEDLPPLFGLSAANLTATDHLPTAESALMHGRRIWYCHGISCHPAINDMILDQVRQISEQQIATRKELSPPSKDAFP